MSTEIARREPVASLPEKIEWARLMADSNLLPAQYRKNPANLLFAVEYADALGVSRINAITSIHVIEGKPSASADLIASLVRRAGHKLRVLGDDTYAEAHLIRADDPDFTYKARWDMTKARQAGLTTKGVWKSYPGAMLRSRVITEVARMGASDALFGVIYTPEELGAEVDADGELVHTVTTVRAPHSGSERLRAMLAPEVAAGTQSGADSGVGSGFESPAGPDNPKPAGPVAADVDSAPAQQVEGITSSQIKKLATAMGKAGITDRKEALKYVADVIGREVSSRNELTKDEASRVINALERPPAEDPWAGSEWSDSGGDEDVQDAELVDEDADQLWSELLKVAGELGLSESALRDDFQRRTSVAASVASAGELRVYLEVLRTEGAAA